MSTKEPKLDCHSPHNYFNNFNSVTIPDVTVKLYWMPYSYKGQDFAIMYHESNLGNVPCEFYRAWMVEYGKDNKIKFITHTCLMAFSYADIIEQCNDLQVVNARYPENDLMFNELNETELGWI